MSAHTIHVVASLQGLSGAETHSASLVRCLNQAGADVVFWSDRSSPIVNQYRAHEIRPFGGAMPRGGTLILVGAYLNLMPWIAHARPQRLVLVCINSDPVSFQRTLGILRQPSLPDVEIVYVSSRLRDTMGLPGIICPEIMDMETFYPCEDQAEENRMVVGRLSRDTPDKHHPDDPSLYRLLVHAGFNVRIMGGLCLSDTLENTEGVDLLPAGTVPAATFLRSLDIFFYRTSPSWNEPSGRVVMEALACGLPVVAHVSGGYTDWIRNGENGFVFREQEEAWEILTTLKARPDICKRMRRAARETANELAGPAARDHYISWLKSIKPFN